MQIILGVEEAIAAPEGFDAKAVTVKCVWNQPYMSFGPATLHASYCFTLYFGEAVVERARQLVTSFRLKNSGEDTRALLPLLRPRFTTDIAR